MRDPTIVYAVCSWNRAKRLQRLLPSMLSQHCPVPFAVLVVDNNSTDNTADVVQEQASRTHQGRLHYAFEPEQGIVPARNRAIEEALRLGADYLVFIDDDELPHPGLLASAYAGLALEGADCVGGRVVVAFPRPRPAWLTDDLLAFLGSIDYGERPFWVTDRSTPFWTGNIGYRLDRFRSDSTLRFDARFKGKMPSCFGIFLNVALAFSTGRT